MEFVVILLLLTLISYLIPAVMPSWPWLVGAAVLVGGPIFALWLQHWQAMASPHYNEGPGGAIGIGIFIVITFSFAWGVVMRGASLAFVPERAPLARTMAIHAAGFAILIGAPAALRAYDAWRLRPPSAECRKATFNIDVATLRLAIPAAPFFSVYLNRTAFTGAYYLELPTSLRDFCAKTGNGRDRIRATHIWIRFEPRLEKQRYCASEPPQWARAACAAAQLDHAGDSDLPLQAHVFSLEDVVLGHFLGTASTYADSLAPRAGSVEVFFASGVMTHDGKPLTFACRESGDGYYCRAGYPWRGGATPNYAFHAPRNGVEERGRRADHALREFLGPLLAD